MLVGLPQRPEVAGNGGRGVGRPRRPAENVLAEQPALAHLGEGDSEAPNRQRVLGADVDDAFACPDGVSGDEHAFQHRVRVALQHAAVHERARVAFVRIADQVLRRSRRLAGKPPLQPGREPGSAAAPQAGGEHLFDHRLGLHSEGLLQALIAARGEVVIHVLGIDETQVAGDDAYLGLEHGEVEESRQTVHRTLAKGAERQVGPGIVVLEDRAHDLPR
jgi:hypothetical protein